LNFDDTVYYMSQYFELYGQHLDCIRDLEASLKALYGTSDIFSIPKINASHCRFPKRVSRTLRRLSHLYSLHLDALLNYWLAPNSEGIPRHEVRNPSDFGFRSGFQGMGLLGFRYLKTGYEIPHAPSLIFSSLIFLVYPFSFIALCEFMIPDP